MNSKVNSPDELNRRYRYISINKSNPFQALDNSLKSANQALVLSDNGDGITADELESAADELQKSMESVVSGGLARSFSLVAEATKVDKSLRDMVTKTTVSALDVVSTFEFMC